MTCTRVVLVKHASPILDPSRPAREWRLGEEGEAQSRRLADRLRAFSPLRLVASPEPKTVISLFAGAHNELDPLGLWKRLSCPSFVVMEVPTFALVEVIANAA